MSKAIQDKATGKWYERWQYHKGYIVQAKGGEYVGALLRVGRLWTVVVGECEERQGTYKTLTEATAALIRRHAREAVAA